MNHTPGLGSFNKDKVANTFGVQLKPKDASRRQSAPSTEKKSTSTESSNIIKNKTNNNIRKDNNTNGFLSNTNRLVESKTPEPTKKPSTGKTTSGMLNTSINTDRSNSLTSNINHSTTKSRDPSPFKSPTTTKRPSIVLTSEPTVSPVKKSNVPTTTQKTEAQMEHKKDQPLDKRQSSKALDHTSSSTTTTSTTLLKR